MSPMTELYNPESSSEIPTPVITRRGTVGAAIATAFTRQAEGGGKILKTVVT